MTARPYAWNAPENWPIDFEEFVYAGRFLTELGQILFGDGWVPPGYDTINAGGPFDPSGIGLALHETQNRQRLVVQSYLVLMGRQGRVVSAYQDKSGELITMPAHTWNVRPDAARFGYFRVDPEHFIGPELDGPNFRDLYIERQSAAAALAVLQESTTAPGHGNGDTKAASDLADSIGDDGGDPVQAQMTSRQVKTAIELAAVELEANQDAKREELRALVESKAAFLISGRQWRKEIWPTARERAGLSPQKPAGRPKKSNTP